MRQLSAITAILALSLAACGRIEDPTLLPEFSADSAKPPPPKPATYYTAHRQLLWGDLHVHTGLSYDAYTVGGRSLPNDAYVFMKGGTIRHGLGYPIRASRPLDFGAVTDHAQYLGVPRHLGGDPQGEQLREVLLGGSRLRITWEFLKATLFDMRSVEQRETSFGKPGMEAVSRQAWQMIIDAAEKHNDPGRFTTFVGYEWTSMPGGDNLHRNVIFRGAAVPERPFSANDSSDPRDLWVWLDEQRQAGREAMAIPHNGNVSNGRMYARTTIGGAPMDRDYIATRMRNEPVSEILQIKGASETHPQLSPRDPFADFEIVDQLLTADGSKSQPVGSYARLALRYGLSLEQEVGANPYRFGFIGSSDSHNASSAVEEDNYHGKLPLMDGTAGLRNGVATLMPDGVKRQRAWGAQGLAAVWAQENTRASIYDALRRRETYATSGPRIALRFFAGNGLSAEALEAEDFLAQAYEKGVPMGGLLKRQAQSPQFVVSALKDPLGANLDRIQIIKGWTDSTGHTYEAIYPVAASDGRVPDPDTGKLPEVGNTVNVADASYSNSIGAESLQGVWQDPDFDPAHPAFYYIRVLEIPTPRYSTYDAKALGVEAPEPAVIQERAISSAIWYSPVE